MADVTSLQNRSLGIDTQYIISFLVFYLNVMAQHLRSVSKRPILYSSMFVAILSDVLPEHMQYKLGACYCVIRSIARLAHTSLCINVRGVTYCQAAGRGSRISVLRRHA